MTLLALAAALAPGCARNHRLVWLESLPRFERIARTVAEGGAPGGLCDPDLLASPLAPVRLQLVRALGRRDDACAVDWLRERVARDADVAVRAEAALRLGVLADAGAVDVLVPLLDDPLPALRVAGARSLSLLGVAPAGAWQALLLDSEPAVRQEAAFAALRTGPGEVAEELRRRLREDPDEGVRWAAARALSAGDGSLVGPEEGFCAGLRGENHLVALSFLGATALVSTEAGIEALCEVWGDPRAQWTARAACARAAARLLASGELSEPLRVRLVRAVRERVLGSPLSEARPLERRETLRAAWVARDPLLAKDLAWRLTEGGVADARATLSGALLEPEGIPATTELLTLLEAASRGPDSDAARRAAAALASLKPPLLPGAMLAPPAPAELGGPLLDFERLRSFYVDPHGARIEMRVRGRGTLLLDLFAREAPAHVAALLAQVAQGGWSDAEVHFSDRLFGLVLRPRPHPRGALASDPREEIEPTAREGQRSAARGDRGALLAQREPTSHALRYGVLIAASPLDPGVGERAVDPAAASLDDGTGAFTILLEPLPEAEGRVTCLGRVALGVEVLSSLDDGDTIEWAHALLDGP